LNVEYFHHPLAIKMHDYCICTAANKRSLHFFVTKHILFKFVILLFLPYNGDKYGRGKSRCRKSQKQFGRYSTENVAGSSLAGA